VASQQSMPASPAPATRGPGSHSTPTTASAPAPQARPSGVAAPALLSAVAHPFRPVYAAACEDGSVQLWAFGEAVPRCKLPRPSEAERRGGSLSAASSGAAAPGGQRVGGFSGGSGGTGVSSSTTSARGGTAGAVEASSGGDGGDVQRKCELTWNVSGDRLLGVGNSTGVCLWTVGEGRGACQVTTVPTGTVHARASCGAFVSAGSVVATAGRRADHDNSSSGMVKTWPHVCAGLCIWDTLAPPAGVLVAHDGAADAALRMMPVEYSCLAWDPNRQRVLCGTKAGELRVFDLRQQRVAQRFEAHGGNALRYCFMMPSTGRFATLCSAAELKVWSLRDFECLDVVPKLHQMPRGMVSNMMGTAQALTCAAMVSEHHLVTGGQDGTVLLTRL